ncbi:MAG TPA: VWA domain-containing protein [Vicinamibacterales bacterium]|nr:VWA domain-containing protein [Vicinamibacterales bacterium]
MRMPVRLALAFSLAGVLPAAAQVYRSGVDLVRLNVVVTDNRGFVRGLGPEDFEVLEDGRPQRIELFVAGRREPGAATGAPDPAGGGTDGQADLGPLRLGLLFDASGSMQEDIKFARTAAVKFMNALPEAADVTFVDFDTEVRIARYGPADFARLVERIRSRKAGGWTALYDAIGVYLHGASDLDGEKVFVLYTDGGDTRSSMDYGELLDLLKASDITMYAIGLLEHQSAFARSDQRMRLQQMAAATGGLAFFPLGPSQLEEMYARIVDEIRSRYTIGYVSTNRRADGGWRRVEVRVTRRGLKGLRVRTRPGYYALYREPAGR